eukprot:TRINITY_DN78710_c0_g1_i1.p1 TRINITY_DN78710_c0_g1~~TRINITY_DN78710_c0_g1_i1.p1  ORF type:complete len:484 (+),score=93.59 TRINITY_DN78710_c0_g1_i1:25-1476(+)
MGAVLCPQSSSDPELDNLVLAETVSLKGDADLDKWVFPAVEYDGKYSYSEVPVFEEAEGKIAEGIQKLKANPSVYEGILYQSEMLSWPPAQQRYILLRRTSSGFQVTPQESGGFTFQRAAYQALPWLSHTPHPDAFTDSILATYAGNRLGRPLFPGRGQGVADIPGITLLLEAQPWDVYQGGVGDCWLLSAISAMAEHKGAIEKIFKYTPGLADRPAAAANSYTVRLYDLIDWVETEVVVDERLCSKATGTGLLGTQPSPSGELWANYLEKAVAAHCGGWDAIDGGRSTHAWRLLTGCRDVYTIRKDGDGFTCFGAKNPLTAQWEELGNAPDEAKKLWPMEWPKVGGGGSSHVKLSPTELFYRMCKWEKSNFLMSANTPATSDRNSRRGIIDSHGYTVLRCVENAAGTGFSLLQLRNPWGYKEFEGGKWSDDGEGWEQYPAVYRELQPRHVEDGMFWVDAEEFFSSFVGLDLCAMDIAEWVRT